jgi:dATP pyrophosphohydrolase
MPRILSHQVEIHVFRRRRIRTEFLCLRRTPVRKTLPGVWQPVTGGIRRGEAALAAAVRELGEETRLTPLRWWALESVSVYFDARKDAISVLPLFAAEVAWNSTVTLSDEHDAFEWLPARSAGARFLWEAQRTALAAVHAEILTGRGLSRALDVTRSVEEAAASKRRRKPK